MTWASAARLLKVYFRRCSFLGLQAFDVHAQLKVSSLSLCILWHVWKWFLFAVDKEAINHCAVFTLLFLSMYFISVCWSSLNRTKGLGEVSRMWGGRSLSSKSITITSHIYPRGMMACLSWLRLQRPWAVCVYLLLLGDELLEDIEKSHEGTLCLTSFFSF